MPGEAARRADVDNGSKELTPSRTVERDESGETGGLSSVKRTGEATEVGLYTCSEGGDPELTRDRSHLIELCSTT